MPAQHALSTIFLLSVCLALITGCSSGSDSGSSVEPTTNEPETPPDSSPPADTPPADTPPVDTPPVDTPPVDTPPADTPPADDPVTETPTPEETPVPTTTIDLSGGDDDSPTNTESLSLQGPFIKDPSRGDGPPSAPQALTLLLSADNWIRFSWVPSTDDQSVEAYEIYRDGALQYTVRGDTNFEFDYRSWLSTSYIDCDFTHYTHCQGTQPTPGSSHEYTVVAIDNEGMRSAASQPAVFSFQSQQNGTVDLSGYEQVLSEEFDGTVLDNKIWKTVLPWGDNTIINGEQQFFVNIFGSDPMDYDPFRLTGNSLEIVGIETPPELLDAANGQPYLSGVITTRDKFEMTYGYVEMSAKVASGQGLLSTFYLFNQTFDLNKPEIDVLEYIGSRPTKAYQTYHYYDSNRARYGDGEKHSSPTMETDTGTDLSAGFHHYAVLWEPELVIWYIDGIEVRRIVGPRVSSEPMNIIAQLVMGSQWIGSPDASVIPAQFEIDYIRAWQKR